jgi:hypothetical protein
MGPGTSVTITGNTSAIPTRYDYFYDWQVNAGTVPSPAVDARAWTDLFPQSGVRAMFMNKAYCTVVDTQGFVVLTLTTRPRRPWASISACVEAAPSLWIRTTVSGCAVGARTPGSRAET